MTMADSAEKTFGIGFVKHRELVDDHFVKQCDSCDANDMDDGQFCEGCDCCQECCNCTVSDCDCDACEERRASQG